MKVLLVSYDLKKTDDDYKKFYAVLESSTKWWHYLKSTWLIGTEETPQILYEKLKQAMDKNDNILIIEVKKNYYGSLPSDAWSWIQENVSL